MQCREGCGACCIAPSISRPYHGMPRGKAAGERCIHLDANLRCELFDKMRQAKRSMRRQKLQLSQFSLGDG